MAWITDGQKQYDALNERYGCKDKDIKRFFGNAYYLEQKGQHIAEEICSNEFFDGEGKKRLFEGCFDAFLRNNFKNYEKAKAEFFLNWDPRGYCIKIEADDIPKTNIFMDFGRNGILIPTDIEIDGKVYIRSDIPDLSHLDWL